MGHCIYLMEQKFCIKATNHPNVTEAIRALEGKETILDFEPHFWYIAPGQFRAAKNILELFTAWRWEVGFDNNGDIAHVQFIGEKLGDEDILFEAIAPYIESGSYIQVFDDDGRIWRWCFDEGRMSIKYAKISFD